MRLSIGRRSGFSLDRRPLVLGQGNLGFATKALCQPLFVQALFVFHALDQLFEILLFRKQPLLISTRMSAPWLTIAKFSPVLSIFGDTALPERLGGSSFNSIATPAWTACAAAS